MIGVDESEDEHLTLSPLSPPTPSWPLSGNNAAYGVHDVKAGGVVQHHECQQGRRYEVQEKLYRKSAVHRLTLPRVIPTYGRGEKWSTNP